MGGAKLPIRAPYGTWRSPIDVEAIFKKTTSLAELVVDPAEKKVYHIESRPAEGGRSVLVDSNSTTSLSGELNVRTRVHEYGGGAAAVLKNRAVFSDFARGRVFEVDVRKRNEPRAVTEESSVLRYADFAIHPTDPSIFLAVQEDHTKPSPADVVNRLVCVDGKGKVTVVAEGKDFYAAPRWDDKGEKLCWIEWTHPDMPWEGSELHYASFDASSHRVHGRHYVAGRADAISITQPSFYGSKLYYLSDETGYYNLHGHDLSSGKSRLVMEPLESDLAEPDWVFGQSTYTVLNDRMALIAPVYNSVRTLAVLDLHSGKAIPLKSPYIDVSDVSRIDGRSATCIGAVHDGAKQIVTIVYNGDVSAESMLSATPSITSKAISPDAAALEKSIFSRPEPITVKTTFPPPGAEVSGTAQGKEVDLHCVLYPPHNPDYVAIDGELPPTLVQVHGGPTSRGMPKFDYLYQYFTSRGFAVLDVDYGGSSGYGREYRQRLKGNWGIVDVFDSQRAVTALAEMGKIDGKRVAIRGGSAGGFTTFACLTDSKVFSAGVSLYGVADLKLLADDTHKFESQYLFKLIGGTPKEVPEIYHNRSPLYKAEQITAALLVLQGLDDKVVPPEQARVMVKKIKAANGDVDAVYYEGEGHGFRKLENLKDSLLRTEAFLRRVFSLGK